MNPTHMPGNEPDPDDMATRPDVGSPSDEPLHPVLPDEEADRLANFA